MRFHCGFSFSWRTIKKFLLPFLLGILAYFGLNLLSEESALGFIKTYALENYDTTTYFYYSNDLVKYNNTLVDTSNHTFLEVVNYINSLSNKEKNYFISYTYNLQSKFNNIRISIIPDSTIPLISLYGYSNEFDFRITNTLIYNYQINLSSLPTDIYLNTTFHNAITCITSSTCSSYGSFTNGVLGYSSSNFNNDNNFEVYNSNLIIYYSSVDLKFDNSWSTNANNTFYKNLYVNDEVVLLGDSFPTYNDILNRPIPEPDIPSDDTTHHTNFFKFVYWFDDNSTTNGLLSNIYIILFIYAISMLTLKFINIVRNTRWK